MHFSALPALCMCTMWVLGIEPETVQEQHMLGTTEPSLLSLKVHTFQSVYNISFKKIYHNVFSRSFTAERLDCFQYFAIGNSYIRLISLCLYTHVESKIISEQWHLQSHLKTSELNIPGLRWGQYRNCEFISNRCGHDIHDQWFFWQVGKFF